MRKNMAVSMVCGLLLVALGLCLALLGGQGTAMTSAVAGEGQPSTPPPAANALITPAQEDFPEDLTVNIRVPMTRTGRLRPLRPATTGILLTNALGGGEALGPSARSPVPGLWWYSGIRYVIYKTPKDARATAFKENYIMHGTAAMVRPGSGSFSGTQIGDLCGSSSDRLGSYTLHFVRDRVSVELWAIVPDAKGVKDLEPIIKKALETTARIIVKRIDGVVRAKGKVDMANLPPIRPPTGPQNDPRYRR